MSSGLETESNALKYIKQVFNTLYVTKDNESLFDLDQLRQLSKDIDDYLTEESVTANGVEDFANRFANNRHRWLSPTFGDMDIPTTVAYCLLFLSCNTSNSNENTCKNLLDEETSPLPGYLITALKSSLSAEGGTGLLNGSFERDCSYNVISNNENRNLVFYFLTLLAANMNCPLKNVLNVLYGDPTRNASIMFNELVTDEILTKVSKEIKQDDKDVALNRDMVASCFGQLCADFEKFDVSKNNNFDEEIVKYVLASSIQPADSNPMVDSLSFMKGKSADVMLLENLTFPLDERGINVVVDGGNKCAKVTDDSLFKDIDFNQGTPQENDFYKNHFATCMTLPLSNDSDTAVSFDTQPLYLLQQLRNKMISIQSSPNVSPEMVEQITKAINELNSMQQRFLLGKILPELLCNYFLNVFNLFLSVVSKQQKNMKANIEMVNSDLAPAEFEALQENPEITSLSAETRKKLGISKD